MKWFKHDSNAHIDAKMKKVRHNYGIEGYGLYWYCLELISGLVDKDNITFELEEDAETIAKEWNMKPESVQKIIRYMCDIGLFESNNGVITCLKLAKRLDDTNAKNPEIKLILESLSAEKNRNRSNSETLGETPNSSYQTRLDKIRLNNISTSNEVEGENSNEFPTQDRCPYQEIVNLYHEKLPMCPTLRVQTDTRRKYIKARWKQDLMTLEAWRNYFDFVSRSKFLTGQVDGSNGKPPFVADLEWLCKKSNFAKVAEHKYHRSGDDGGIR